MGTEKHPGKSLGRNATSFSSKHPMFIIPKEFFDGPSPMVVAHAESYAPRPLQSSTRLLHPSLNKTPDEHHTASQPAKAPIVKLKDNHIYRVPPGRRLEDVKLKQALIFPGWAKIPQVMFP